MKFEDIAKNLSDKQKEKMEQDGKARVEKYKKLWSMLGTEGLELLADVLITPSSFSPEHGYSTGYGDNYAVTSNLEEVGAEAYARRQAINKINSVLVGIYQIAFPVEKPAKEKKDKIADVVSK